MTTGRDCLNEDSVKDCAVVNEYVEESQEADVDMIVIGQQEEEENEEEADYEDDIEIHEESLEDWSLVLPLTFGD